MQAPHISPEEDEESPDGSQGGAPRVGRPSYEDIETLAYLKYLDGGGQHGRDWEHWLEAEAQLNDSIPEEATPKDIS